MTYTVSSMCLIYPYMQVYDCAVTVMIGDDPYTLGLFDTASKCVAV